MTDNLPALQFAYQKTRDNEAIERDNYAMATGLRRSAEKHLLDALMLKEYGIQAGDVIAYQKRQQGWRKPGRMLNRRLRILTFQASGYDAGDIRPDRVWFTGRSVRENGEDGVAVFTIYGMHTVTLVGKVEPAALTKRADSGITASGGAEAE